MKFTQQVAGAGITGMLAAAALGACARMRTRRLHRHLHALQGADPFIRGNRSIRVDYASKSVRPARPTAVSAAETKEG